MTPTKLPKIALLALLAGSVAWLSSVVAEQPAGDKKLVIVLPKDPSAVVITFDPGAGGFKRKAPPPYLKIQADGQVTVVSPYDGSKKESKITTKELEDLVRFIIEEKDFFNVTAAKIDEAIKKEQENGKIVAIRGAGTTVISVQANDKKHEVGFVGASSFLRVYPKIEVLAQFASVEGRLTAFTVEAGKGT